MPPKKEKRLLFQPKDMVLAKMTGFPAWPSFVMPPDMIPDAIMRAKKKTTNTCVIFIPDGDFNWMNEKSLEALSQEKLQAKLDKVPKDKMKSKAKKKSTRTSNVFEALSAANGLDFDDFMEELDKAKASFNEDFEDEDADADNDEDIEDEIEYDDDRPKTGELAPDKHEDDIEDPVPTTKSNHQHAARESVRGKRRSPRSARDEHSDTESTAKNGLSVESPASKDQEEVDEDGHPGNEDISDPGTKQEKVASAAASLRKRTRGSRDLEPIQEPELINGGNGNGKVDAEEPSSKRATRDSRAGSPKPMSEKDRQHQLWLCRIKLQRSLIQRNQPVTPKDPKSFPPPTVDELSMARIILQKLADFPVTVDLLRDTKIHKVLKCIVKDEDLEYPDSFRLHEKCKELLDKWHSLIENLKSGRMKPESRIGSSAPEDSEISGIELKPTLDKEYASKVGV